MQPESKRFDNLLTGFFLSKQAEGCSPNTVIEYRKDVAHFKRWLQGRDYPEAGTLTSADLKAFLADLRTVPNGRGKVPSSKTIYNAWVVLRRFYR